MEIRKISSQANRIIGYATMAIAGMTAVLPTAAFAQNDASVHYVTSLAQVQKAPANMPTYKIEKPSKVLTNEGFNVNGNLASVDERKGYLEYLKKNSRGKGYDLIPQSVKNIITPETIKIFDADYKLGGGRIQKDKDGKEIGTPGTFRNFKKTTGGFLIASSSVQVLLDNNMVYLRLQNSAYAPKFVYSTYAAVGADGKAFFTANAAEISKLSPRDQEVVRMVLGHVNKVQGMFTGDLFPVSEAAAKRGDTLMMLTPAKTLDKPKVMLQDLQDLKEQYRARDGLMKGLFGGTGNVERANYVLAEKIGNPTDNIWDLLNDFEFSGQDIASCGQDASPVYKAGHIIHYSNSILPCYNPEKYVSWTKFFMLTEMRLNMAEYKKNVNSIKNNLTFLKDYVDDMNAVSRILIPVLDQASNKVGLLMTKENNIRADYFKKEPIVGKYVFLAKIDSFVGNNVQRWVYRDPPQVGLAVAQGQVRQGRGQGAFPPLNAQKIKE